ncbi:MAG: autotransporter domain-containing protein, partial [Pseudomonadales bacterium]
STATLSIATINDTTDEADGFVSLRLNLSRALTDAGYSASPSASEVTITINDDDQPSISISVTPTSGMEGTSAVFTVTARPTPAIDIPLTVPLTVVDSGDFITGAAPPTSLTLTNAAASARFTVATADDEVREANGAITARLADPTSSAYTLGTRQAVFNVQDNDTPSLSIRASDNLVTEGGTIVFTITSSFALRENLNAALNLATEGDYFDGAVASSTTLMLAAGQDSAFLTVNTVNDDESERDGSITVSLAPVGAGADYAVGTPASARVVIDDDDGLDEEEVQMINTATLPHVAQNISTPTTRLAFTQIATRLDGLGTQTPGVSVQGGSLTDFFTKQLPQGGQAPDLWDMQGTDLSGHDYAFNTPYLYEMKRQREEDQWRRGSVQFNLTLVPTDLALTYSFGTRPTPAAQPTANHHSTHNNSPSHHSPSHHSPLEGESKQTKSVLVGGSAAGGLNAANTTTPNAAPTPTPAPITFWARAYHTDMSVNGTTQPLNFNGEVQGAMAGIDYLIKPNLLIGLALSDSKAKVDFKDQSAMTGTQETSIQAIHPYFGWQLGEGTRLWGSFGLGQGDTELRTDERPDDIYKSDVDLQSVGLGLSNDLVASDSEGIFAGASLAVIADAYHSRISQQGGGDGESGQLRFGLEAKHSRTMKAGQRIGANLALTVRQDFGDTLNGRGIEFSGGVAVTLPSSGLTFDMDYRTLLSYDDEVQEWGVSGGIAWTTGVKGRGFSLAFKPQWGSMNDRSQALWEEGLTRHSFSKGSRDANSAPDFIAEGRYSLELKYGIPILSGEEMINLFTKSEYGADDQRIRLGADLNLGKGLTAEYEAALQPGATQNTEHRAQLRYERRF